MINISTKTGDQGESGLANGLRLPKSDLIFEVLGTLDELNSWLGLVLVELKEFPDIKLQHQLKKHLDFLASFQETIFKISAILAGSAKLKLSKKILQDLEKLSEQTQGELADDWHQKFLMPGGTKLGAYLDLTRTVCRRAERQIVKFNESQEIDPLVLAIVNRFSDYLYVFRCLVNHHLAYSEKEFKS